MVYHCTTNYVANLVIAGVPCTSYQDSTPAANEGRLIERFSLNLFQSKKCFTGPSTGDLCARAMRYDFDILCMY